MQSHSTTFSCGAQPHHHSMVRFLKRLTGQQNGIISAFQRLLIAVGLVCLSMTPSIAQTQYVTDQLEAQLRSGTGTEFRIIALLTSGRPVEVIDTDAGNGYTQIRVGNTTGFILSRHLSTEPSPRDQLEAALANIEPLESQNTQLNNQVAALQAELENVENQNIELTATNGQLKERLERIEKTSQNAIQIDQRNAQLVEENLNLKNDLEFAQQEVSSLKNNSQQRWMITGGLIGLIGLIAGLIIPRLKLRPDQRWSNQL